MNYTLKDITEIWEQVKVDFVEMDGFPQSTADLWFEELEITELKDNNIVILCKSAFKLDFIKKYIPTIENGFARITGENFTATLICNEKTAVPEIKISSEDENSKPVRKFGAPAVKFDYTFDNFIEGSSNTFVRAACWAVAENCSASADKFTASAYNPLFIYGPSGIGKTHLMYAVLNKVKEENPNINIIYIKGADFTNHLVDSLGKQEMNEFRKTYNSCDLLIIDDIQFIAGKTATQEEFFHTFNSLYENGKQIILTSDRPPREIKPLEDRLKSRFEMGLIADIQPPNLELRIAIIKKKADFANLSLSDDVLLFLAENLRTNIRQIEGAIKKLTAHAFLLGKKINIDVTKSLLAEILGGQEPISVTVDKIFASVYKRYGFKKEELIGTKRTKELAMARHITIYLIRQITEMSLPNIGKIFNRDHSTVLSSIDNIEKRLINDSMLSMELNDIIKEVTEVA